MKKMKQEVEETKHQERVAREEAQRFKSQLNDQKRQIKNLNQELEELQQRMLDQDGSSAAVNINQIEGVRPTMMKYENDKMEETIQTLKQEIDRHVADKDKMLTENSFFHQSTTIFINLKKLATIENQQYIKKSENETKIAKKMAIDPKATVETSRTLRHLMDNRAKIEDLINTCRESQRKLEGKLKDVLARCKSLNKNQKDLMGDVTLSKNQTRIMNRNEAQGNAQSARSMMTSEEEKFQDSDDDSIQLSAHQQSAASFQVEDEQRQSKGRNIFSHRDHGSGHK